MEKEELGIICFNLFCRFPLEIKYRDHKDSSVQKGSSRTKNRVEYLSNIRSPLSCYRIKENTKSSISFHETSYYQLDILSLHWLSDTSRQYIHRCAGGPSTLRKE
jgi:hypothetical protein